MTCKFCKGSGQILMLYNFVPCECVESAPGGALGLDGDPGEPGIYVASSASRMATNPCGESPLKVDFEIGESWESWGAVAGRDISHIAELLGY